MREPTLRDLKNQSLTRFLDRIDRKLVLDALHDAELNVSEASRILKIRRSTLQGKMRKHKIKFRTSRKLAR